VKDKIMTFDISRIFKGVIAGFTATIVLTIEPETG